MKEWRGVIMQLANIAAIVYLATHPTKEGASETLQHYALASLALTNLLAHTRARLDAGTVAAVMSGGASGGGGALLPLITGAGGSLPPGPVTPNPDTRKESPRAKATEAATRAVALVLSIVSLTSVAVAHLW